MDLGFERMHTLLVNKVEYNIISRAVQFDAKVSSTSNEGEAEVKRVVESDVQLMLSLEKAQRVGSSGLLMVMLPDAQLMQMLNVFMAAMGTLFNDDGYFMGQFEPIQDDFSVFLKSEAEDVDTCMKDIMDAAAEEAGQGAFVIGPDDLAGFDPSKPGAVDDLKRMVAEKLHLPMSSIGVNMIPISGSGGTGNRGGSGARNAAPDGGNSGILTPEQASAVDDLRSKSFRNPEVVLEENNSQGEYDGMGKDAYDAMSMDAEIRSIPWNGKLECNGATVLANSLAAVLRGDMDEAAFTSVLGTLEVDPGLFPDRAKAVQALLQDASVRNPMSVFKGNDELGKYDDVDEDERDAARETAEARSVLWDDKPECDGVTLLTNATNAFSRGEISRAVLVSVLTELGLAPAASGVDGDIGERGIPTPD